MNYTGSGLATGNGTFKQRLHRYIGAHLPRSRFVRGVAVLTGSTAFSQGLMILAAPVVTRLYAPEDFGILAVYAALLAFVSIVASLRYELAIPIAEDDEAAGSLLVLCILAVIGSTAVCAGLIPIVADPLLVAMNSPGLRPYIWLLPVGVLGAGFYKAASHWAFRHSAFSRVARTKVSQSVGNVVVQIILGAFTPGGLGLIVGQAVGQSAGGGTLLAAAVRSEYRILKTVTPRKLIGAARRFVKFPLYSSWSAAFNTLSLQVPTIILAAAFGPTTVGLYALSTRVLQTPMKLVGQAIGQVFFATAAEANRKAGVAQLTRSVFTKLAEIGVPSITLLALVMPELFRTVFGSEWEIAGLYSQWLAPWMLLVFISSPLSTLTSVLERQGGEAFFQGVLLFSRVVSLAIGAYLYDALVAIAFYGIASAGCWLWYILWTMRISGNSPSVVYSVLAKQLGLAIPFIAPVLFVNMVFSWPSATVATACISASLILVRTLHVIRVARQVTS